MEIFPRVKWRHKHSQQAWRVSRVVSGIWSNRSPIGVHLRDWEASSSKKTSRAAYLDSRQDYKG